jgi:hypothetical protein
MISTKSKEKYEEKIKQDEAKYKFENYSKK